jgi:cytoskeletal protein CcmA (bactofilin family)
MGLYGLTIVVNGEVRASGDLTIQGRVDGPVWCDGALTLEASSRVAGDVVAQDITVFGRASGQLIATDVVDVRPGAVVTSDVIAPSFILHDGAAYCGRVDPARLDAALSVARFRLKQRDTKTG